MNKLHFKNKDFDKYYNTFIEWYDVQEVLFEASTPNLIAKKELLEQTLKQNIATLPEGVMFFIVEQNRILEQQLEVEKDTQKKEELLRQINVLELLLLNISAFSPSHRNAFAWVLLEVVLDKISANKEISNSERAESIRYIDQQKSMLSNFKDDLGKTRCTELKKYIDKIITALGGEAALEKMHKELNL